MGKRRTPTLTPSEVAAILGALGFTLKGLIPFQPHHRWMGRGMHRSRYCSPSQELRKNPPKTPGCNLWVSRCGFLWRWL